MHSNRQLAGTTAPCLRGTRLASPAGPGPSSGRRHPGLRDGRSSQVVRHPNDGARIAGLTERAALTNRHALVIKHTWSFGVSPVLLGDRCVEGLESQRRLALVRAFHPQRTAIETCRTPPSEIRARAGAVPVRASGRVWHLRGKQDTSRGLTGPCSRELHVSDFGEAAAVFNRPHTRSCHTYYMLRRRPRNN